MPIRLSERDILTSETRLQIEQVNMQIEQMALRIDRNNEPRRSAQMPLP
jgi:hypothetical protein